MGQSASANLAEQAAVYENQMKRVIPVMEEKFKFLYVDSKILSFVKHDNSEGEDHLFRYEGPFKEIHQFQSVIKGDKSFITHILVPNEQNYQQYAQEVLSYIQLLEQSQPYVSKTALPQLKYWTILERNINEHKYKFLVFIYEEFNISSSLQMKSREMPFNCQTVYSFAISIFKTLVVTRNLKINAHFDANLIFIKPNSNSLVMIPSLPCGKEYNKCDDYLSEKAEEGKQLAEVRFIDEKALAELRSLAFLLIKMLYGPTLDANVFNKIFIGSKTQEIFKQQYLQHKTEVEGEIEKLQDLCRGIIAPFLRPPQMIPSPVEYLKYLQSAEMVKLFRTSGVSFSADDDAVGQVLIGEDLEAIRSSNDTSFKRHCLHRESLEAALMSAGECLIAATLEIPEEEFILIVKELIAESPRVYQFQACYSEDEIVRALRNIYLQLNSKQRN